MADSDVISEYEAAAVTAMSPTLLKWLTSYAPKHGSKRKLTVARQEDGVTYFERDEVVAFDAWLKQPWPRKNGARPNIPSAIRDEVRIEANGACAICQQHKGSCEAAHLDPVAKSDNNHPENLLWLCSNHHTVYDKGLFGPDKENAAFVAAFKQALTRHKVQLWRMQHRLSVKAITLLETCVLMNEQLQRATTKTQIKAIKDIARKTLDAIPVLAPVSDEDPKKSDHDALAVEFAQLRSDKVPVAKRLRNAGRVREKFVAAYSYVECPVCDATGRHDGQDCPVCLGDRQVEKSDVRRIDLDQYRKVECPLCEGDGEHDHEPCPACGGEGSMDKRYADYVDTRDYETVDCPLCEGKATYNGDDCPACRGEGEMARQQSNNIDLCQYDEVDCPLCEGKGRWDGEDCPECRGYRQMQRRFADEVNIRGYEMVECSLCNGKGRHRGEDCPVCNAEREISRHARDGVDLREYQLVSCPVCAGHRRKVDDCNACHGEGEMERRFADRIDPSDYE